MVKKNNKMVNKCGNSQTGGVGGGGGPPLGNFSDIIPFSLLRASLTRITCTQLGRFPIIGVGLVFPWDKGDIRKREQDETK